jgi:hypothetical protein
MPSENWETKRNQRLKYDRLSTDRPCGRHGGLARLSSEEWGQDQMWTGLNVTTLSASRTESNFSMEYASPVRDVLKAARSETSENDEMCLHKRSVIRKWTANFLPY